MPPRWVWITWSAIVTAVLVGMGLWIVQGAIRGVPGPVLSGVYIDGSLDAVIVGAYAVAGAALATIGCILITRVSTNPIGWILTGVAAWLASTFLLIMVLFFLHSPGDSQTAFANWLGNWTFVISVPTSLVLMIFPSGALPSRRWRILPWLAVVGIAGWITVEATADGIGLDPVIPNPFANPGLSRVAELASSVLLVPALVGTVASLVVRYRRSPPEVRLQIKWVALSGVFQIFVWLGVWGLEALNPEAFGAEAVAVGTLSVLVTPAALAVAILRYKLYEIDRLVSRTVSYTLLVGLLVGLFAAGVIGTQAIFGASSDLAVAGTTLAVAALFNPLRRHLHESMDRRFNRRRFDAERVIEAFALRVGSITDTETLASDLTSTVTKTLSPASLGIWIRA